jgi:triacylglycerol lipase
MSTIVLAHGFFGFGSLLPGPLAGLQPVHYFNGVARHFREELHLNVFEPQTNPIGCIKQRATQLAQEIEDNGLSDPLYIIAHSMGGLDARYLIAHLPETGRRVATLVTIGTPHGGSTAADALVNPTDPLRAHIPAFLLKLWDDNAGALRDLTTDSCKQFNQDTPDVNGVRYVEIAGNAPREGSELLLYSLAAKIGNLQGDNDGVVTVASALRPDHEHLAIWPVDHAGEIGWSRSLITFNLAKAREAMAEHLTRYDAIIAAILPQAAGA